MFQRGGIMKIPRLFLLLCLAGYTVAASTDTYQISGTVIKKGGGPLEGVIVLLKGKKDSVVTGADGKFELVSPVAVRMNAPRTQTLSFTLRGNVVAFSQSSGKLSGNVSVLSGNGRCLASTDFFGLDPATEHIALPQLASGFNIVRVTLGNTVYTCRVIRVGSELHLINKHAGAPSGGDFTLIKRAASSVTVDTIVASKEGFEKAEKPLESYTLSDVSVEMDSIVEVEGIAWGKEENPTAHCEVGTLPEYNALQANPKLPDPFLKLDGTTRISNKSEWPCRREEILRSLFKYVFGEKPIPKKGSVTGTVTESKISVKVSEDGKSCTFDVTVDLNGATAPAPAIIYYDGGLGSSLPIPKGVAKIRFSAIEAEGGSGNKTGPFYTFYGATHPAGYLIAQAWQISRIIDLLEDNPGVIDPYRIGLTGCSRNGKGAFIGGVLDNRVALTLPCESGIGGTVALRLVEKLDTGGEWPYHAISYVRWFSEVALGKFTSANNAGGDNTDRLPVDMHSAMALIAPRGIYIIDNPSGTYPGLDKNAAWVTGSVGKIIFEALGVGDHFAYQGASGGHCTWRNQYDASLNAMIDKFLKGNASANTGNIGTDLGSKPDPKQHYDWPTTELTGEL